MTNNHDAEVVERETEEPFWTKATKHKMEEKAELYNAWRGKYVTQLTEREEDISTKLSKSEYVANSEMFIVTEEISEPYFHNIRTLIEKLHGQMKDFIKSLSDSLVNISALSARIAVISLKEQIQEFCQMMMCGGKLSKSEYVANSEIFIGTKENSEPYFHNIRTLIEKTHEQMKDFIKSLSDSLVNISALSARIAVISLKLLDSVFENEICTVSTVSDILKAYNDCILPTVIKPSWKEADLLMNTIEYKEYQLKWLDRIISPEKDVKHAKTINDLVSGLALKELNKVTFILSQMKEHKKKEEKKKEEKKKKPEKQDRKDTNNTNHIGLANKNHEEDGKGRRHQEERNPSIDVNKFNMAVKEHDKDEEKSTQQNQEVDNDTSYINNVDTSEDEHAIVDETAGQQNQDDNDSFSDENNLKVATKEYDKVEDTTNHQDQAVDNDSYINNVDTSEDEHAIVDETAGQQNQDDKDRFSDENNLKVAAKEYDKVEDTTNHQDQEVDNDTSYINNVDTSEDIHEIVDETAGQQNQDDKDSFSDENNLKVAAKGYDKDEDTTNHQDQKVDKDTSYINNVDTSEDEHAIVDETAEQQNQDDKNRFSDENNLKVAAKEYDKVEDTTNHQDQEVDNDTSYINNVDTSEDEHAIVDETVGQQNQDDKDSISNKDNLKVAAKEYDKDEDTTNHQDQEVDNDTSYINNVDTSEDEHAIVDETAGQQNQDDKDSFSDKNNLKVAAKEYDKDEDTTNHQDQEKKDFDRDYRSLTCKYKDLNQEANPKRIKMRKAKPKLISLETRLKGVRPWTLTTLDALRYAFTAIRKHPVIYHTQSFENVLSEERPLKEKKPGYPESPYTQRLHSFTLGINPRNKAWNNDRLVWVGPLVAAGFSYEGEDYIVVCKICGCRCDTSIWTDNDEPYAFEMHRRGLGQGRTCAFLFSFSYNQHDDNDMDARHFYFVLVYNDNDDNGYQEEGNQIVFEQEIKGEEIYQGQIKLQDINQQCNEKVSENSSNIMSFLTKKDDCQEKER